MDSAPDPDADLVRRARDGSQEALAAIFERHGAAVRGYIEKRLPAELRRKIAPEDVLQETWMVAAERLTEFEDRGEGALKAWLLRIADLKARESIRAFLGTRKRAEVREISRHGRPDTAAFVAAGPSPSEVAQGNELREAASRAMAALPEDYRDILRLVQSEGLTLRDAALRMGRTHDAAKKLYGRALRKFAEMLGRSP